MKFIRIIFIIATLLSSNLLADQSKYYSAGQQTNASANTVLANSGPLSTGGLLGANYEISIILNGSSAMTYKLEVVTDLGAIGQAIHLSAPANQAISVNPRSTFFIPNNYSIRIRNDTGVVLGATLQAAIILKIRELVDQ